MNFLKTFEEMTERRNNKEPVTMGIWTFYKDRLTIEDDIGYIVYLDEIDSTGEFLDWILQIHSKVGFDFENFVNLLIYAADWNFNGGLQGVFCPCGENKNNIKWRK